MVVTIDFETYYDKDYSLSKLSTEEYIRSPEFEVIGVGVKVGTAEAAWYSAPFSDIKSFLTSFDWSSAAILCHNTVFDGAILSWHFGIKPAMWLDTLSMARPHHGLTVGGSLSKLVEHYGLGKKGTEVVRALGKRRRDFSAQELSEYGSYCKNDVELTYALFKKLKPLTPLHELAVIDKTLRMFTEPNLELDSARLAEYIAELESKRSAILNNIQYQFGLEETDLRSNPKFADALLSLGVQPPMKISKTTGKSTYAFSKTDTQFTKLLESDNDAVRTLVEARLGVRSSIERTRAEALFAVSERGTLPVFLNYWGAHTGRFSGGDKINLQNLPRNGNLRRAICAPRGHVVVAADLAQIEARLTAWLAGQEDLVQAFREGRDVYSEFATKIYGRPITKADKVERFVGKTCILGLGYGLGGPTLRNTLAIGMGGISVTINEDEAKEYVRIYRKVNAKIAKLWEIASTAIKALVAGTYFEFGPSGVIKTGNQSLLLPNNTSLKYPYITEVKNGSTYYGAFYGYLSNPKHVEEAALNVVSGELNTDIYTRIYGGKLIENVVQALATCLIKQHMVSLPADIPVVLQVHDELVTVVPEELKDYAVNTLAHVMSQPPTWAPDLPVACEVKSGYSYGECK